MVGVLVWWMERSDCIHMYFFDSSKRSPDGHWLLSYPLYEGTGRVIDRDSIIEVNTNAATTFGKNDCIRGDGR